MIEPGARVILDVEKPVAGGRMLARHSGRVVLVSAAIPGERVSARIERVGKGVVYAETITVLAPSSDRRDAPDDWRCGGNVYSHVAYARQLQLKAEVIRDGFVRLGHISLAAAPEVVGSPERGYRMRARLHAQDGRIGFFREGTHQVCDAAHTYQLLPATIEWVAQAEERLAAARLSGLAGVEIAENIPGDERVCHLELHGGTDPEAFAALGEGLTGLSAERTDRAGVVQLAGVPRVSDTLRVGDAELTLGRDVRAFFQGNRFLVERLAAHVAARIAPGPVVDLYAGVGLFGLAIASIGKRPVTLVEGDPISGSDLQRNAAAFGSGVRVERRSVEAFLRSGGGRRPSRTAVPEFAEATFIVDPPRTGMSRDALTGVIEKAPARIVYVSCDVATLARDSRALIDAGYALDDVTGVDLFPNTAHIETIAVFVR
jgi:23S rRNA (uracil1939-C5)-methyltransferase